MSTTRIVDVAAMPGAQEADERAAELAWRLPAELAPLARASGRPGQPLVELNDKPQVVTVPLDLEASRAWRDKFPAHLDADAFTLET